MAGKNTGSNSIRVLRRRIWSSFSWVPTQQRALEDKRYLLGERLDSNTTFLGPLLRRNLSLSTHRDAGGMELLMSLHAQYLREIDVWNGTLARAEKAKANAYQVNNRRGAAYGALRRSGVSSGDAHYLLSPRGEDYADWCARHGRTPDPQVARLVDTYVDAMVRISEEVAPVKARIAAAEEALRLLR
jgi:hypothetical protein